MLAAQLNHNAGTFFNAGGNVINNNAGGTINLKANLLNYGTINNKCGAIINGPGIVEGNPVVYEQPCDTTPPTITVNPVTYHGESFSYANDQQFYYGDVPPKPTCTAVDEEGGSGLDTEYGCQVSGYSTDVGIHNLDFTAKDKAGNTATKQISYEVLPWTITGFYSPVKMTGVNTIIRGVIVPLKFEVFAGSSTELKNPSTVVASLTSTKVDCSTGDKLGEPQPFTPQSGTSLRYNTLTGQFIFYWRTPYQSNVCYDVQLTTKDGSAITAHFKLVP